MCEGLSEGDGDYKCDFMIITLGYLCFRWTADLSFPFDSYPNNTELMDAINQDGVFKQGVGPGRVDRAFETVNSSCFRVYDR